MTFVNCVWKKNWVVQGGIVWLHGHSATFWNCEIDNNLAEQSTKGIVRPPFVTLPTLCVGGMIVALRTAANFFNCTLHDNIAYGDGGGISISFSKVQLQNCSIANNTARTGAGLSVDASTVKLHHCSIVNNNATSGAGLYIRDTSSVELIQCSLVNNTAKRGGGCFILTLGTAELHNSSISMNTAERGAGLYLEGRVKLYNCVITSNIARVGAGLFAVVQFSAGVEVYQCSAVNNSATDEGFLFSEGSSVVIQNCSFLSNSADGGGVFSLSNRVLFNVTNTVFENNTCTRNDGGVIKAIHKSIVNLRNSQFVNNRALSSTGGCVYLESESQMMVDNSIFLGNMASAGGVIMVTDHSAMSVKESNFSQNSATADDKNICLGEFCYWLFCVCYFSFDWNQFHVLLWNARNEVLFISLFSTGFPCHHLPFLQGIVIIYACSLNFLLTDESHGGAIFAQIYSKISLFKCHFAYNSASDDGGAVYLEIRSQLNMSYSFFQSNKAVNSGGSIFVKHSKAFLQNSKFEGEEALRGLGGSVFTFWVGNITVGNSTFAKCHASQGGSLAGKSESTLKIRNTEIWESSSNASGGALHVTQRCSLILSNVTISDCLSGQGGALLISDSSTSNIHDTNFLLNKASNTGAAICCKNSFLNFTIGNLYRNRALFKGGGIYADRCSVILGNITISDNLASNLGGGIFASHCPSILMHNCITNNNTAEDASFMITTHSSRLKAANLRLGVKLGNGSAISIAMNSRAELRHFIVEDTWMPYCPVRVTQNSQLVLRSWHKNNEQYKDNRAKPTGAKSYYSWTNGFCVEPGSKIQGTNQSGEPICHCLQFNFQFDGRTHKMLHKKKSVCLLKLVGV